MAILGTSSPACQLLKPIAYQAFERTLQNSHRVEDQVLLAKHCPHLARFMRSQLQGSQGERAAAETFLAALAKVRFRASTLRERGCGHASLLSKSLLQLDSVLHDLNWYCLLDSSPRHASIQTAHFLEEVIINKDRACDLSV